MIKALEKGTSIEMFFLDPDGDNCRARSEQRKINTRTQILDSLDMIESELTKSFGKDSEKYGSLQMYTYDLVPRDNLIFIYTNEDAYVFVQSYSHSMPGTVSPCSIIKRKGNNESSPLFEYYEKLYEAVKGTKETIKQIHLFDK